MRKMNSGMRVPGRDTTRGLSESGYKTLSTEDIIRQRETPYSDPAGGDNMTYQDMPWTDKASRKRD